MKKEELKQITIENANDFYKTNESFTTEVNRVFLNSMIDKFKNSLENMSDNELANLNFMDENNQYHYTFNIDCSMNKHDMHSSALSKLISKIG